FFQHDEHFSTVQRQPQIPYRTRQQTEERASDWSELRSPELHLTVDVTERETLPIAVRFDESHTRLFGEHPDVLRCEVEDVFWSCNGRPVTAEHARWSRRHVWTFDYANTILCEPP